MTRTRFYQICDKAWRLHHRKNKDYGHSELGDVLGLKGRFVDLWRKITRLKTKIWDNQSYEVDEKAEDTAIDLIVYAIMFYDNLTERMRK